MTTYKFNSENEYQLWCQNKINAIYYANIAMNNEKICETVQEIARTLHCSEDERLVKPEPLVFIISYNKGMYDDMTEEDIPFTYHGTLAELDKELNEKLAAYIDGYKKIQRLGDWTIACDKQKELAEATCVIGNNCKFYASTLYDSYEVDKKADFNIYHIEDWIKIYHDDVHN